MSPEPYLSAPTAIQIHAAAAFVALVLGPWVIYRPRRDRLHKTTGYVWIAGMAVAAMSSFAIHSFPLIGPFSPIHLLACLALWSIYRGIAAAVQGDIRTHREVFRSLYWYGLVIAGLVNFLPGRTTNRTFFGEDDHLGWVVIGLGGTLLVADFLRRRGRTTRIA
ncbi:DUF2306 domain-containing protein [Marivivens marinus]|uniref:DUF2306 domain-containing protein n=1 Tax=Marivivens marinus TaxID=3110173 RepID=UPI003B84B29D